MSHGWQSGPTDEGGQAYGVRRLDPAPSDYAQGKLGFPRPARHSLGEGGRGRSDKRVEPQMNTDEHG